MLRPDRRVVRDALDVVPHAVAVDRAGSRPLGDAHAASIDGCRDTAQHVGRCCAHPLGPCRADQLVVAADAAGGHDDRGGSQVEAIDDVPVGGGAALGRIRGENRTANADDGALFDDELVHPVAEADVDESCCDTLAKLLLERRDDARTRAPGDVEAWHGVAMTGRGVAAALGPADDGEEANASLTQPGAFLGRGEPQVGLGPLARPIVLLAVESRGAEPVLPREFEAVLHPEAALLGRVDQKDSAERPPGLPAEARLGLLVEHDDALTGVDEFGRRDEPGQTRANDDRVGTIRQIWH